MSIDNESIIKIFLVEDEFIMREGIKNNIDWVANGFEFCGEAADGELALPLIKRTRPDIVITDIKMPFMDGLELSRAIKEILPDTQIIILSGYAEFDYAKEAIKLGIREYLTKPIDSGELLKVVKEVAEEILQNREANSGKIEETEKYFIGQLQDVFEGFKQSRDTGIGDENEDLALISEVDPSKVDRVRLTRFLSTAALEETDAFCGELFDSMGDSAMESLMFRQYVAMDTYFCAAAFIENLGCDRSVLEVADPAGTELKTATATKEYIVNTIKKAICIRDESVGNKYGEVVADAVRYIDEHYAEDELSLNDVAGQVNLSPNHFSAVFSQEMGRSFIKYLTDLRMEKAKALLKTTALRSSDISLAVGYKDPHYFSFIFKKTQGVTPTQFREGK